MRIITYVVLLIIIVLGLTFAFLNANPVTLNYYLGSSKISLSLLLVLSLTIGVIIGLLVIVVPIIRLKSQNRHLKSRVTQAEKEIENLRSIPIKDTH